MSREIFRLRGRTVRRHPGIASATVLKGCRQIRFNRPAVRAIEITRNQRVTLLLDREKSLAAFRSTHDENGYTATLDTSGGATVSCLNFLRSSGIPAGPHIVEPSDDDGKTVHGFRFIP